MKKTAEVGKLTFSLVQSAEFFGTNWIVNNQTVVSTTEVERLPDQLSFDITFPSRLRIVFTGNPSPNRILSISSMLLDMVPVTQKFLDSVKVNYTSEEWDGDFHGQRGTVWKYPGEAIINFAQKSSIEWLLVNNSYEYYFNEYFFQPLLTDAEKKSSKRIHYDLPGRTYSPNIPFESKTKNK